MIQKGQTKATRRSRIRKGGKIPSTPELYLSEEGDGHLDSSEDEEDRIRVQRKMDRANRYMEIEEDEVVETPLQTRYETRSATQVKPPASAAPHVRDPVVAIDVDMTQDEEQNETAPAPTAGRKPVLVPTLPKAGPSEAKKAAAAQLKVALKTPRKRTFDKILLPSEEQDELTFPLPEPTYVGGAGGLLGELKDQGGATDLPQKTAKDTAERMVWEKYNPDQQFGLYMDMKTVITKQASAIDKLIKNGENMMNAMAALHKRDAEKTAEMAAMQEQISAISDRLTGTNPTRDPSPATTPPTEQQIETGTTEEEQFPMLPSRRHTPHRRPPPQL